MNAVPILLAAVILVAIPLGLRRVDGGRSDLAGRLLGVAGRLAVPGSTLAAVGLLAPAGPMTGLLVAPWLGVAGLGIAAAILRFAADPERLRPNIAHAGEAALGFLGVGAIFLAADRLGVRPFGFEASIVLLTAVHFHVAGFVLLVAGADAWRRRPSRWLEAGLGAVVVGVPVTALGFLGLPLGNLAGALLVAGGGFIVGFGHLVAADRVAGPSRWLVRIAGLALLASTPLAAWFAIAAAAGAAGPDAAWMARVHGGFNVLGFAVPAMVGWTFAGVTATRPFGAGLAAEAA
jgi:hypothetical protein